MPRFDSDACFASLVGECENGHWQIQPAEGIKTVKRRYRDETLVLETTFETDAGVVLLIDFMPLPREGEQTIEVMRIVVGKGGAGFVSGFGAGTPEVLLWRCPVPLRCVSCDGGKPARLIVHSLSCHRNTRKLMSI